MGYSIWLERYKDALFKCMFVLADMETYLYIIHTFPVLWKAVYMTSLFPPHFCMMQILLLDKTNWVTCCELSFVWLIRLSRTLHMVVVLPDISGWLVPAHDFTEDVHHVKVIFQFPSMTMTTLIPDRLAFSQIANISANSLDLLDMQQCKEQQFCST